MPGNVSDSVGGKGRSSVLERVFVQVCPCYRGERLDVFVARVADVVCIPLLTRYSEPDTAARVSARRRVVWSRPPSPGRNCIRRKQLRASMKQTYAASLDVTACGHLRDY
jgi:hypothetical protein